MTECKIVETCIMNDFMKTIWVEMIDERIEEDSVSDRDRLI